MSQDDIVPLPVEVKADPTARSTSIAVLSGKGGSGKTLIVLSLLRAMRANGSVLVVDADPGTGGLSYFLSLNYARNQGIGLLGLLLKGTNPQSENLDQVTESFEILPEVQPRESSEPATDVQSRPIFDNNEVSAAVRQLRGNANCYALPIGDIRRFIYTPVSSYRSQIEPLVDSINLLDQSVKIFDCRGGIDRFTLAICRKVESILVVTETDVASVQSTKNLVDILRGAGLESKIGGYCINRLFAKPSNYSSIFTGLYGVPFLGGIPFDLESLRRFLVGRMPLETSSFAANASNVGAALMSSRPEVQVKTGGPVFKEQDFERLSLRDPREIQGQALGATLVAAAAVFGTIWFYLTWSNAGPAYSGSAYRALELLFYGGVGVMIGLGLLGLLLSFDGGRRLLGRVAAALMRPAQLIFARRAHEDADL